MDQFLETYSLPRLSQEEMDTLSRPTTSRKIEFVIKRLSKKKSPWPDGFTGEFCKALREEVTQNLHNIFQETKEKGILPTYSKMLELPWYQKQKISTKENRRPISLMNIDTEILNKILAERI